jgi:hypothetical protein
MQRKPRPLLPVLGRKGFASMRDRQDSRQPLPLANRSGGLESLGGGARAAGHYRDPMRTRVRRGQSIVELKAQPSQRFQEGN